MLLNAVLVGVCLLFASLYPKIGDILRYFRNVCLVQKMIIILFNLSFCRVLGSICGLVYVFTLPLLLDLAIRSRTGQKSSLLTVFYVFLIGLGLANFIAQFVVPVH